jgi:hypothetical protein
MTLWSEERLTKVARAGGLERRRNGLWSRPGEKGSVRIDRVPPGWVIFRRPYPQLPDLEPLAEHGDWAGPAKLVVEKQEFEHRVELFLGGQLGGNDESFLDEEATRALERLSCELFERFTDMNREARFSDWKPPALERMVGWLHEAGHETAVDKEQHLRFTLKRRGCDGQVRVECGEGRLRFVLPLGRWKHLKPEAGGAMRRLAGDVNRHRLVRIAWIADVEATRCEAQVDLSGLPVRPEGDAHADTMWSAMTRLAVGAMELALRQLGLELALLAEPAQLDLTAAVFERASN